MTDHDLRKQLHQIIDDIDSGRLTLPRRRAPRLPVGSTVLVAALGLGLMGCGGNKPGTTSPQPTTTGTTTLPAPEPMYGAPEPPPDRNVDPDVMAEYMAPDVDP